MKKGEHRTEETKRKISIAHMGMKKPWAGENGFSKGHIPFNKGKKADKEWRDNLSKALKKYFDKIGTADIKRYHHVHDRIYLEWRNGVFERDNYTCQACGQIGGDLQAHHIRSWAEYPDLRYVIDNGLTLCIPCHKNI
jgi:hypothetical protein